MAGEDLAVVRDLSCISAIAYNKQRVCHSNPGYPGVSEKFFWSVLTLCQVLLLPQGWNLLDQKNMSLGTSHL